MLLSVLRRVFGLMPSASIQLTFKERKNEGDGKPSTGDLTVSIGGIQTRSGPNGTEYGDGPNSGTAPVVRVESANGGYQKEKQVGTFLRATFPDVPVTTLNVTATHPDYAAVSGTVKPGDFSSQE